MLNTPILFIVFNRPSTTEAVFGAIRNIKPTRLYIAADAPRPGRDNDLDKCQQVKDIVNQVNWKCDVKYLYQEANLGCSLGPRAAFDWFFKHEEAGIILEDDCLPNQSFFYFCEEMLERYKSDEQILAISGSNLGYKLEGTDSYTFSGVLNMWGWATWRRSAEKIDYKLSNWKKVKNKTFWCYKHLRQNLFDTDINWYKYWVNKFDRTVDEENITWWDWQWIYHQIAYKKLSIVPAVNLVSNIGFGEGATHTYETTNPAANIPTVELSFPLQHPKNRNRDLFYEEYILKWVLFYHKRLPWSFYLKHNLRFCLQKLLQFRTDAKAGN